MYSTYMSYSRYIDPARMGDAIKNYDTVKLLDPGQGYIVVSDIHGKANLLYAVLDRFNDKNIIFLGDIMDRGPDSRICMELVTTLIRSGKAHAVIGNHDIMSLAHIYNYCNLIYLTMSPDSVRGVRIAEERLLEESIESLKRWFFHGGIQTYKSFGGNPSSFGITADDAWYHLFDTYVEYLKYATGSILIGSVDNPESTIVSHASVPVYSAAYGTKELEHFTPYAYYDDYSKLQAAIKEPLEFFNSPHLWDRPGVNQFEYFPHSVCTSIHGHTIQENPTIWSSNTATGRRIYIDVGSFKTNKIAAYNTLTGICYICDGNSKTWEEYEPLPYGG